MSSKKSLAARLLTRAFRPRPAAPIRKPGSVGGRIEELEDRSVPATFHVALTGDDTTGLGTVASPYRSIQKALDVANVDAGTPHTIKVAAGTYSVLGSDNGFGIGNSATPTPNLNGLGLEGGWNAAFTTQTVGSTTYIPQTNINNSAPSAFTPDVIVYASGVTVRGFTFVFDGQVGAGGTRPSGGLQSETTNTIITQNTVEVGFTPSGARSVGIVVHSVSGGSAAGVQVTNNTVVANAGSTFAFANASTGILVNPDTPGRLTPIIVSGNNISGPNLGVGITVDRLSYVTVDGNTIQRTGTVAANFPLIDLRQANAGTGPYATPQTGIVITNNTLDGLDGSAAGSMGIDLSARGTPTQQVTGVTITGNVIRDVAFGVFADDATVQGSGVNATANSLTGITNRAVFFGGSGRINASANWFGSATLVTVSGLLAGSVDFTPYLNLGTDTSAATGFQPDYSDLTVHAAGGQTGATARIQEGVNLVTTGGTVNVFAGSYTGGVDINRTMTVVGGGLPAVTTAVLSGQEVGFLIHADDVVLDGFAVSGAGGATYGVLLSDKAAGSPYTNGTVRNSQFTDLEYGVATADGAVDFTNALILNNTFDPGTGTWGVYLQSGSGHTLYGNSFSGTSTQAGILVQFADNVTVGGTGVGQANSFSGLAGSLLVADAVNTAFVGNTVTGTLNNRGAVRLEGNVSGITVSQNTITGGVNPAVRVRQNFSLVPNSGVVVQNNTFSGNSHGIQVDADGLSGTLDARFNSMSGSTTANVLNNDANDAVDASGSYLGSTVLATVAAGITGAGAADYTPFLNSAADTSAAAGFQGDDSNLIVHPLGTQNGPAGRITEAYGLLTATGTIQVRGGTYTENVDLTAGANKAVTLAAGASPGQVVLNGNLTLGSNDTLAVEIGGTSAATDYDNFLVTGTVTLGGATLSLAQFGGFSVNPGVLQAYTIIDNDGGDAVTGIFAGLPEGTPIGYAGGTVYISYSGGDGNDVVLYSQPVVNGTPAADTFLFRQVSGMPGVFELSVNSGPFVNLGAISGAVINGLGGNDTLTIDGVHGNPFPTGGIGYDGGTHTSTNPGDQLIVVNGTYTTITHNFSTASSGNIDFDGRVVTYTGLEPVLVDVGSVGNVVFNLPAAASTAVLEDDGVSNTLSRLRSTNGTFETTTFSNPTGSVTINRGDAADTLSVTALPDLTSTLTIGSGANPFGTVTVAGAFTPAADKNLSATASGTISLTAAANVTTTGTGSVSLTTARDIVLAAGSSVSTVNGGVTLSANAAGTTAGDFNGILVLGTVTTSGTGAIGMTGRGGSAAGLAHHAGIWVVNGGVVRSTGTAAGSGGITLTGHGAAGTSNNDGVIVEGTGSTVTSVAGPVALTGTAGAGSTVFNIGVLVFNGGQVTSTGTGAAAATITLIGTGGAGSNDNYGVNVDSATVSSVDGAVQMTGVATDATGANQDGVRFENGATVTVSGTGTLGLTGTAGNATGFGVNVIGATTTLTAAGLATLTGLSASNVNVTSEATANFGNLTAAAGAATVTIFEDSPTAVNTIAAATINLTSAGAITDNNVAATNLSGTTAALAAAGGIDLDTTLGSLTATTSAAGAITIDELDAITLTSVTSGNGLITVVAGGTITATSVVSSTDDDANDITLTATGGGNVAAATVNAGPTAGDVFLSANTGPAGSIVDDNVDGTRITGDVVTLTAFLDIGLPLVPALNLEDIDTAANTIVASTTGSAVSPPAHGIWIDEADAVALQSVTTADGLIRITTGGSTAAQSVVAAGAGRNVTIIESAGDLTVTTVTSTAGNVTLQNATGNILDDAVQTTRVGGATVTLTANLGTVGSGATGDIDTAATNLAVTAGGNASVNEFDGVNVNSATVGANVFELSNAGALTQTGVITAGGLRLLGSGAATLTAANLVGTLAAARDGGLGFTNAQSLTVGTVTGSTGTTSGITLTPTGSLTLAVTGTGNSLAVGQPVAVAAGTVTTSSAGNTTVNATVTASGAVQLSFGQDNAGRAAAVNAVVTGSTATVIGGTGSDTVTVTATGATILDVNGGGVPTSPLGVDLVTAVLGGLGAGYVRLNNPGAGTENYRATVDGAAQTGPLTFHANTVADELGVAFPTASGVRRVGVNGATVLDYGPAGATVSILDLLGGTAADGYFVQFTDPAVSNSLLPPLVNVTANGGTTDAARVYGTNSPDTVGVNVGDNNRVTSAGVAVQYDGSLEALTVYGKDESGQPGDTFAVRPDQQTAITIHAGTPLIYPGDTLELDVLGLVTLNPTFSDPALPNGTFSLTGYGLLTWTSIENFPVPRGMGGSFDFGPAGAPVQFGFTGVLPTTTYPASATEGTGWHGWATTPQYGNVAYNETNLPPAIAASPLVNLLRDYAYGWNSAADVGVFRVDVAPNKPVQLTAILGTPIALRDGQVVEWGVANTPTGLPTTWTAITPANGTFLAGGEMTSVSALLTATQIGNNQSLFVRFRDIAGEPYWSVSALDVRPTNPGTPTLLPAGLVAPLPIRREFSTNGATGLPGTYANQPAFTGDLADGSTIDYYRGKDAIPGSLLTVTVTNGTVVDAAFTAGDTALGTRVLNGDAAGYFLSFQVQADASGEFTFGVRRPTGTATSTVTVADATGFRAGTFTQAFVLPGTRRIDFGPLPGVTTSDYGNGGTVGLGYIPFATAAYTSTAANALGWAAAAPTPLTFTPGGTGVTVVQADGVYGGYTPSEFVFDMPQGNYVLTATLGDASARRDDIFVEVFNGTAWVPAKVFNPATGAYDTDLTGLTSPAGVSPNAGQSMARTFLLTTTNNMSGIGQLRVRFGNVTGNPNWTLSALEVRPTQATLTVSRTSAAPTADGTTVSTYEVTGAAEGTVLTIRPALGALATADANSTYDGIQVVVPPSGIATFSITAPFSTTIVSSIIEVESVTGAERGTLAESYAASPPPPPAGTPTVRRFDFNGPANDTNPNMTGVRGSEVWTTGADYGWLTPVADFERATSTLPASMTAAQKSLFRDGATLGGPKGTFRVKVSDVGADYAVRYYVGDSAKKWPWIRLQVEGGAASGQLATNVNQYWSYIMFGKDLNSDGYLDVSIFGSATWVLNAIDVAKGTTAAALPPSLFAPSPQAAAFTVTSGAAPTLTAAELAPIVAEAVSRWTAAGADPARLTAVTVSITDLNDAGRLGEHVPGSIHIDDDAGGRGWFVDATPADDAEFGAPEAAGLGATGGAAARGVDLLTVVMHELGHELGLDESAAPADVMAETLDVGVRRLPTLPTAELPAVTVELPTRPTATTKSDAVMMPAAELPARPTVTAKTEVVTVTPPAPALWLDEVETVSSAGVPVVATDDRVKVLAAEPVVLRAEPGRVAAPPVFTTTAAWPDADALLLDLDGVFVG